jgi:hypothetical protein
VAAGPAAPVRQGGRLFLQRAPRASLGRPSSSPAFPRTNAAASLLYPDKRVRESYAQVRKNRTYAVQSSSRRATINVANFGGWN